MILSRIVTPSAEAMARQVGDETVILDLASGNYYGLDPVGSRFWQLLGDGKNLSEIIGILIGEYDVPREQLELDLDRLIQELLAQGLVSVD